VALVILVSIIDAAYFTHIPAGTIRRWVAEHKITSHGPKPCKVDMLEIERLDAKRRDRERASVVA
jgi:hypothetical protein